MATLQTPVCVIGAGPAGSTASLFLSKYGIAHVLVEREQFPREKVCGEAFAGRVQAVLRELNPDWAAELLSENIAKPTEQMHLWLHAADKMISVEYDADKTPVLRAKRYVFDHWLLEKARASNLCTYIDNTSVASITQREDGIRIVDSKGETQIDASLAIVCVGENRPLLLRLFPDYPTQGTECVVSRRYFAARAETPETAARYEFHLFAEPIPYMLMINPMPDGSLMVEVGTYKKQLQVSNVSMENLMERAIGRVDSLRERLSYDAVETKPKGIAFVLGKIPRKLSDKRVLLAGSAIGTIHPVTGFGVGHAMRSGQLAAQCAAASIQAHDFTPAFLQQYDRSVRRSMRNDFVLGRLYALALNHIGDMPWLRPFLRVFTRVFASNFAIRLVYSLLKKL